MSPYSINITGDYNGSNLVLESNQGIINSNEPALDIIINHDVETIVIGKDSLPNYKNFHDNIVIGNNCLINQNQIISISADMYDIYVLETGNNYNQGDLLQIFQDTNNYTWVTLIINNGNIINNYSRLDFSGTFTSRQLEFKVYKANRKELSNGSGAKFIGYDFGSINTVIGSHALERNTLGRGNLALGTLALKNNTTGDQNIAFGTGSLCYNTNGYNNLALGEQSLFSNTTGANNIALGGNSLYTNTTGYNNIALGHYSLLNNTTGNENTAIGENAGLNYDGSDNIMIGYCSGYSFGGDEINKGSNNVLIGTNIDGSNCSNELIFGGKTLSANNVMRGSNTMILGNDEIEKVFLPGFKKLINQTNLLVGQVWIDSNDFVRVKSK